MNNIEIININDLENLYLTKHKIETLDGTIEKFRNVRRISVDEFISNKIFTDNNQYIYIYNDITIPFSIFTIKELKNSTTYYHNYLFYSYPFEINKQKDENELYFLNIMKNNNYDMSKLTEYNSEEFNNVFIKKESNQYYIFYQNKFYKF